MLFIAEGKRLIYMELFKANFLSEINFAVEAALSAGEQVMHIYQSQFSYTLKDDQEPVTKADVLSDEIIRKMLLPLGYAIFSEESADDLIRLKSKRVWIIDPLDGTNDFVNKTGEFTIMIGLVEAGSPLLGVIYSPSEKIIYYAAKGQGAFVNREGKTAKLKASATSDLNQSKIYTSRHHFSEIEKKFLERLGVKKIVACGSSKKLCLIAGGEGELNINLSDKTWEWDICAADIILSEAGGRLTDRNGKNFIYNKKYPKNLDGYVASNGLVHKKIIEELK